MTIFILSRLVSLATLLAALAYRQRNKDSRRGKQALDLSVLLRPSSPRFARSFPPRGSLLSNSRSKAGADDGFAKYLHDRIQIRRVGSAGNRHAEHFRYVGYVAFIIFRRGFICLHIRGEAVFRSNRFHLIEPDGAIVRKIVRFRKLR